MGIFKFDDKIVKANDWPHGWPDMQKKEYGFSANIYFYHRYTSLQNYDTGFITRMEALGHTFTYGNGLPAGSYREYDIIVIGALGTTYGLISELATLLAAVPQVFSFCRATSQNCNMSTSNGTRSSTVLRKLIDHEKLTTEAGGNITFTQSNTVNELRTLTSDTVMVYDNGTATYPGLAYKQLTDKRYIVHYSHYYSFAYNDQIHPLEATELMNNTIQFLTFARRFGIK